MKDPKGNQASTPERKKIELLFTHCWRGKEDLPFPTAGPAAEQMQGKTPKELPWLAEELEESMEQLGDWKLVALHVGDWDGEDEVVAYATLENPEQTPEETYQVVYDGEGGYQNEVDQADQVLKRGESYTLERAVVGRSSTSLHLKGKPHAYNSALFEGCRNRDFVDWLMDSTEKPFTVDLPYERV